MRIHVEGSSVTVSLTANETYEWANRAGARWPCSTLAGRRLWAAFDSNGLYDLEVDGRRGVEVDGTELSAICADHLRPVLSESHPAYLVAVGQFA